MLPIVLWVGASVMNTFEQDSDPPVRGFLHTPATPSGDVLVLTHSAGSNSSAPLLVAVANAFAEAGFTVLRCDLPYRQNRPHGPPYGGDAARDREGLRYAVAALKQRSADCPLNRIFLGGHSYGGRQASMLAAEDPDLVSALLLLSYPLHPPNKPDQLRTTHFPALRVPALFVHGTRDPFGSLAEMEVALKLTPGRTALHGVEGASHDLGFSRKTQSDFASLPRRIVAEFLALIDAAGRTSG